MNFKDFIRKGLVRRASRDKNIEKSLYKNTISDLIYLNKIKIDEFSSRKILTNYYDCLRTILEVLASIEGFKIYQHEAFVFYLKEKKEGIISLKFDRFRKIRNAVNYYGKDVSVEETKEYILEIKKIINYLIDKYLSEFS